MECTGLDAEDRAKWTRIWQEYPVLENVYLQRRQGGTTLQQLGPGPPPTGGCTEDGRTQDGLTDFSKDLSMLAKQSKLEVKLFSTLSALTRRDYAWHDVLHVL